MAASQSRDDPACSAALTHKEDSPVSCPHSGDIALAIEIGHCVGFMNPTRIRHNMSGRYWVGVLIGLTIVALTFGLT